LGAGMQERNKRKTFVGVVESSKMDKTITVRIDRLVKHKTYGKYMKRTTKLKADDPENACNIGDKVRVTATRPLSKTKRWRLVAIIEKAH
jgi:small subunit ribosomal protein S17